MKLLVVEDNLDTSEGICEYFKEVGYEVTPVYDGEHALNLAKKDTYDLILLDVMLPKRTGLSVLYELRKCSAVPVIMLTAIEDEYTQIASFDGLADDYVTKPFSVVLLEKRVEALLRRTQPSDVTSIWQHNDVMVDFNGFTAEDKDGAIDITPKEVLLLQLLIEHKGKVLSSLIYILMPRALYEL